MIPVYKTHDRVTGVRCPNCKDGVYLVGTDFDDGNPDFDLRVVLRTCKCDYHPDDLEEALWNAEWAARQYLLGRECSAARWLNLTLGGR